MTYRPNQTAFVNYYNEPQNSQRFPPTWNFEVDTQSPIDYSHYFTYRRAASSQTSDRGPLSVETAPIMAEPSVDEMEQFQQLSDHYKPDLPGPLIGSRKPLSELVIEYSQADPTYVAKTQALAATHSAYRQIKGDGQCGWRGAVFGYFELLFKSQDLSLVIQEEVRLRSHEQTMRSAGIDYDIIIDMFEYTWELFDAVKAAIERHDTGETVLLQSLNDENVSNSIVYHFKMMTSAFMELHADRYEAFLEMSVQQYRLTRIDPTNQEIDHVGLQVLTDAVIAPAFIAVEVSYLDRSSGDEVTSYEFVDNAKGWPTIRLIYRPGHYDIIYKDDHPQQQIQQPVQVYLHTDTPSYIPSTREHLFRSTDPTILDELAYLFPNATQNNSDPSTSFPNHQHFPSPYQSPPPSMYAQGSPHQIPHYSEVPSTVLHAEVPQHPRPSMRSLSLPYQRRSSTAIHYAPQISPSPSSPQPPSPATPSSTNTNKSTKTSKHNEPQIRYNEKVFDYSIRKAKSIPLDPTPYGSAATSPAHFSNPGFQPLVWEPGEEYGKRGL